MRLLFSLSPLLLLLGGGAAALSLSALSCTTTNESQPVTSTSATEGALPCEVDAALAPCRRCHQTAPAYGAPMPLVTLADLHAPARSNPDKKVYELVATRVHADEKPMPPSPNPRLTDAALDVLDQWIANGAPAGATTCEPKDNNTPPTGGTTTKPLSCPADVHMAPASAWSMPETTDDEYVCYGFDVTNDEKRHLVGIAPIIDNPSIVHHLVLFQSSTAISTKPAPCPMTTSMGWRIVYGWAPGGGNFEFPPEAGYPQEKTTHYVVQIHYNNINHKTEQKDASGFDFCTTSTLRPNDADSVVFGTTSFSIPARSSLDLTCDMTMPTGLPKMHVFAAFPHMHQLGTAIETSKIPTDGSDAIPLGAQSSWDFQNQVYFPIDAVLEPGDKIRTRCAWKNTGSSSVSFGERTQDEMCFSFTMYWPRIKSGFTWMSPTQLTKCHPTQ